MKKMTIINVLLLLVSFNLIAAVSISADQHGQAIIVPYFTVANDLNTAVSINNTQYQPKAVKVSVREGREGAAIYTFNVYLDANDIWTFAMSEEDSTLQINTEDSSCVIYLSAVGNGDLPEWNQHVGSIEIIEMGNISTESDTFFGDLSVEENCSNINDAWYANGPNSLWQADPSAELMAVSGGLTADVKVVDVAQGFTFSVPTTALNGFFPLDTVFHTEPESTLPDLSSGTTESILIDKGQAVQTTWPTGYEAVSALLMKTHVENEYEVTAEIGAISEWVLSFPTARFHKNNTETQAPFIFEEGERFRFPGISSDSYTFYDRNGKYTSVGWFCVLPPPGVYCPPVSFLNHFVTTYVVNPWGNETPESIISGDFGDHIKPLDLNGSGARTDNFLSGKVKLNIETSDSESIQNSTYAITNIRGVNTETDSVVHFHGLPVIGFNFQIYHNANAQPGLLATYATAKAHYGNRLITE